MFKGVQSKVCFIHVLRLLVLESFSIPVGCGLFANKSEARWAVFVKVGTERLTSKWRGYRQNKMRLPFEHN